MKFRGIIAALAALSMLLVACGEDVEIISLSVGQCFDNPQLEGSNLTDVDIVGCDESHIGEVYGAITSPDGDFPGDNALNAQAEAECVGSTFESYVGIDYNSSDFYAITIVPSAESWEAGDRVSYCVVADGTELASASPIEGSLRGSGR